jgi:nitroreductase
MTSENLLSFLQARRSVSLKLMTDPGPDQTQIHDILKIGSRIPDHGKLFPWHFIVFADEARRAAGNLIREAFIAENPDTEEAKLTLESERFLRAPVVIAVISRIREGKIPLWEQILSAGAACYNVCLAANATGFGTCWLTEWMAYSPTFKRSLGLDDRDHIVGFIYIGTATEKPEDRDRPDLTAIVTHWQKEGQRLHRGDAYGRHGHGYAQEGFTFNTTSEDVS